MPPPEEQFLKRLLATFQGEAREHIQVISSGLVQFEKAVADDAKAVALDEIFRAAHSLKGAARTVNVRDIEIVCQSMESVFASLKRKKLAPSLKLFDLLHKGAAILAQMLQALEGSPSLSPPTVTELLTSLQEALTSPVSRAEPKGQNEPAPIQPIAVQSAPDTGPAQKPVLPDTIRVSTTKLDAILLQVEELVFAKLAANHRAAELAQLQLLSSQWKKEWAKLRGDVHTLHQRLSRNGNGSRELSSEPHLLRIAEFLDWNQHFFESLNVEFTDLAKDTARDLRVLTAMTDSLRDEMKNVVMLPFSSLVEVFPRFVREWSRSQGKEIELTIGGGDIEMDRRLLEEMKDPLVHLVRNCLDHGIEPPHKRLEHGKPSRGSITISAAAKDSNTIELLISDDGRGIEASGVKAAIVKSGALSAEKVQAMQDQEALAFVFKPGISTSPLITDISGRGLGLAIVQEKVDKLKGVLSLETNPGKGTTFRIILPRSLARFRGVIVRTHDRLFVLPSGYVERVARVKELEIKTVENRKTIAINGRAISLVGIDEALGLDPTNGRSVEPGDHPVAIISYGNQRIAFRADEILGEQEILVKTLGKQLARVRNIAGVTILGDGRIVPILNVADLMASAVGANQSEPVAAASPRPSLREKKSVLVAEDSITSRTLLKNILETAGFTVATAVDGIDAFTKLRSGNFHAVVSDVDMPRLNGFGLTAKIRADKKFSDLPVILVTALDSQSDREHGIDVGASAYIVKSSFDQSNLLEVIQRLA